MLTTLQLQTLKAFIETDPVLSTYPNNGDGHFDIAVKLNLEVVPDFFVWSSQVPTQTIFDAIIWANMTPPSPTGADSTGIYRDRALCCQGKQFNIQTMLVGRDFIDATKQKIRDGLQDALTALPSKADGSNQGAGWNVVQAVLSRKATVGEKVFATGTGTVASPASPVLNGIISPQEVSDALNPII